MLQKLELIVLRVTKITTNKNNNSYNKNNNMLYLKNVGCYFATACRLLNYYFLIIKNKEMMTLLE
jgi:hypothetical protein